MGISLDQYRQAIGAWSGGRPRKLSQKDPYFSKSGDSFMAELLTLTMDSYSTLRLSGPWKIHTAAFILLLQVLCPVPTMARQPVSSSSSSSYSSTSDWSQGPVNRACIETLLLVGGVEPNPGPLHQLADDGPLCNIPGRAEFRERYPTDHDTIFADINNCPPHLRHHFDLPLLDENFLIPEQIGPYIVQQHKTYIEKLEQNHPDEFNRQMERFVQGPGGHIWYKNPDIKYPTPSKSSYVSRSSGQPYYCIPQPKQYATIETSRPELFSSNLSQIHRASMCRPGPETLQLNKCDSAINLELRITHSLLDTPFLSQKCHPHLDLENSLINMCTTPGCVESLFYASIFSVCNTTYVRFLESGTCEGFYWSTVNTSITSWFPAAAGNNDIFSWQVLYSKDISQLAEKQGASNQKQPQLNTRESWPDKTYAR